MYVCGLRKWVHSSFEDECKVKRMLESMYVVCKYVQNYLSSITKGTLENVFSL